ncbi:hypothetical protein MNBD_NITROSPIRAE03-363 [hydrothermal vent metagenome]|uniref:Uncharacterized protein n=1 Tax=hydrothermal vent metagenome TaxID=652676 RepID=A0A3B1CNG1_9ZZZZ
MAKETGRVFSLILVPASGRVSEAIITPHHPGETKVIIKSVQTLCLFPLPRVDSFFVGNLECDGAVA